MHRILEVRIRGDAAKAQIAAVKVKAPAGIRACFLGWEKILCKIESDFCVAPYPVNAFTF